MSKKTNVFTVYRRGNNGFEKRLYIDNGEVVKIVVIPNSNISDANEKTVKSVYKKEDSKFEKVLKEALKNMYSYATIDYYEEFLGTLNTDFLEKYFKQTHYPI